MFHCQPRKRLRKLRQQKITLVILKITVQCPSLVEKKGHSDQIVRSTVTVRCNVHLSWCGCVSRGGATRHAGWGSCPSYRRSRPPPLPLPWRHGIPGDWRRSSRAPAAYPSICLLAGWRKKTVILGWWQSCGPFSLVIGPAH